ncbi:hypothetical protein ACJMK2_001976 [Sinanodonta woodiana]|uniref:Uncharacterized protein n=1 Tax=Sinanodonta woodiana TaxID=1069815 RepID=A0ABD3XU01_SINWO
MTIFKNNCLIACLCYLCTIIGYILLTAGFLTPAWKIETSGGVTRYSGLIMACYSNLSCTFDVDTIKSYASGDFSGFQIGAMTLGIAAWVFGLVELVVVMVYSCFPLTVTGILSIIFAFVSGISGIVCVIIYGSGIITISHLPTLSQLTASWSLGLFTGGSVLMIAVGIVLIVNVCVL